MGSVGCQRTGRMFGGQCSRSGRGGIILVDDVLEFVLVTDFSRPKLQTAQFDDDSYDGVLVVAM